MSQFITIKIQPFPPVNRQKSLTHFFLYKLFRHLGNILRPRSSSNNLFPELFVLLTHFDVLRAIRVRKNWTIIILTSCWPVVCIIFVFCKSFCDFYRLEASNERFVDSVEFIEFWKSHALLMLKLASTIWNYFCYFWRKMGIHLELRQEKQFPDCYIFSQIPQAKCLTKAHCPI